MTKEAEGADDPFALVGETLAGRFRVERLVAEGGFGVVYRAQQLALDRPVAIKVFKASSDLRDETFEAEARTVALLKHPSIVEVYDFGVSARADGPTSEPLRWMALEWLPGRTLDAFLAERRAGGGQPMEPAAALALLRPVLQALAFCHRQGVAHRDLKPGNILLAELDGVVAPKVLDFGIAQMLAGENSDEIAQAAGKTTRGIAGFSPDYAAPEQVSYGRTGPWTDVHALGLILSEMLTGEPPYPQGEADERFAAVVSERRPTPAAKGIAVGPWEPVVARALARRPADRYPDADGLLLALESTGLLGQPVPRPVRAPPGPRRRRPTMALGAVLAVLAVAGLLSWGISSRSQKTPADRVMLAVLPFDNLTGDPRQEYFSDGLTEGMITELSRLAPARLGIIGRTSVMQYKGTRKTLKAIGQELGVGYLLECSVTRAANRVRIDARLLQVADQTQLWAENYERQLQDVLALQSDVAQAIAAQVRLKLRPAQAAGLSRSRPLIPAAYDAYLRGRYQSAKMGEGNAAAIAHFEEAIKIDPAYAAPHAGLAAVYVSESFRARPAELGMKAKAAALRAVELDAQSSQAYLALGHVNLFVDWDWAGARRHVQRALDLNDNDAEAHIAHGLLALLTRRFPEAIAGGKRALELEPVSPVTNVRLAQIYSLAGRHDEALAQVRRARELDPNLAMSKMISINAYYRKGMLPEAMVEAQTLKPDSLNHLRNVGLIHARAGRAALALAAIDRMAILAKYAHVSPLFIARIYAAMDRRDDAFAWLEKGYRERELDLVFLRVESMWDPLRDDPRFADLVGRVGIPDLRDAAM